MRLQSLIIPEKPKHSKLYYRGETALAAGGAVSFDTYYNSFSYTKYRNYTDVKSVVFSCRFGGTARLELCVFDGAEHIICGDEFSGAAELSADLYTLPENGFLYPKITAITDVAFESGEYRAECAPADISCCIAICTYKRESFVIRNTALLRGAEFSFIRRVFVVDNGNTLDASMSDGFIKILPNRNFGGSGGFTRGLIEARDGGFTHVILMDDDVEFHPQTLEQMTVFISLLTEEYRESWLSTAMIPLDDPSCQFELGAEWDGKRSVVHKHNVEILNRNVLLDNLDNPDVEYGGWWTLLMPVSVTNGGLPYPFFIKFDDVEYGMRKPFNTEIITMNGIAVRHDAFDKKKSFVLDYYNLRNELAVNAVYGKYGGFGAAKRFMYEAAKHLSLYRYDNIPLVFRAANDFLSGAKFFLACDEEKLNGELIRSAPKLSPLEEIDGWNESLRCDDHVLDKRLSPAMVLTLGGHLIPAFMLKYEISAVPLSRTGAVDCFGKSAVIQYQLGGGAGILTKRNFGKFLRYSFASLGMALKLIFGFGKAQKSLLGGKDELCSEKFWRKHLGI